MNIPHYPTDIDTPETLLIQAKMMTDHAMKIAAFDWAVALKQIQAALFWASTVKQLMEEDNAKLSDQPGKVEPS